MRPLYLLFLLPILLVRSVILIGQSNSEFIGPEYIVNDVDISSSNEYIIAGFDNGDAILWSKSDQKIIHKYSEHYTSIRSVAFSPKYPYVLTGSDDSFIKIWRLNASNSIRTIKHNHSKSVTALEFSNDGKYFVSGGQDGKIILWKFSTEGKATFEGSFKYEGDKKPVSDIAISPNGQYLSVSFLDDQVALWRFNSRDKPVKVLNGHKDFINSITLSSKYILSGSDDGRVLLRSSNEDDENILYDYNYHDDNVYSVALTSDEKRVISCGAGGKLIIGDLEKRRIMKSFSHPKKASNVTSLSISNNDKFVITGASDGIVRLWLLDEEPEGIFWIQPEAPINRSDSIFCYQQDLELNTCINSDSEIKEIKLYHNGKPIEATKGLGIGSNGSCKKTFKQTITLEKGMNQIHLVAYNQDNEAIRSATIRPSYIPYPPMDQSTNYLLLIGINEYKYWDKLQNAVMDIESIKKELIDHYQFKEENTYKLVNNQASYRNIESQIKAIKSKMKYYDNLIIYYSGHGEYEEEFTAGYIIPYDKKTETTEGYIPYGTLLNWIGGIRSRHTYLILDACYAGKMFENSKGKKYNEWKEQIPSRRGLTSGFGKVLDGTPGKHSPFTKQFLEFLRMNRNKPFPSTELEQYLKVNIVKEGSYLQDVKGDNIKVPGFKHNGGEFIFYPKKNKNQ